MKKNVQEVLKMICQEIVCKIWPCVLKLFFFTILVFSRRFRNILKRLLYFQKQPPRDVRKKRCSENMQQIYRRTPMPKCDFIKVALQFYWNRTPAWVFSCRFAVFFQDTFSKEHLWVAASVFYLKASPYKRNCADSLRLFQLRYRSSSHLLD